MMWLYTVSIVMFKKIFHSKEEEEITLSRELFIQANDGKLQDYYELLKEIGRGAYGVVYKAQVKAQPQNIRAIKVIKKQSLSNPNSFLNEINILKKLDHPNIIQIYETFQDSKNYYVVTDFCEGGELFDRLSEHGSFNEHDARLIFSEILYAVKYCHEQHIAHRDLKPENFLFLHKDALALKIIDFGLSYQWQVDMKKQMEAKKQNKLIGTPYYIAPEILKRSYDQRCDLWSLGVILYILVTAAPPFDGDDNNEIMKAVKQGKYTFNIPEMKLVSEQLKDLIRKLLVPDTERLTIPQIYDHPWMKADKLNSHPLKLNFSKMKKFMKYSKLKKYAVSCIASQIPSKDISILGDLFEQVDLDHDGFITTSQLKQALEKQHEKISKSEVHQLLKFIDTDHNGKINYCEFVACCLENSIILKKENLRAVFNKLDRDGNGTISPQQLRIALSKTNPNINASILKEIIDECDLNGDGMIEYTEFQNALCK